MEQKDCQYNFEYDGTEFDIHISTSPYLIKGMYWLPKTDTVRGVFIYLHGLNSFVTSERDTATLMNEHGYAFFGSDHIGHGRSEGPVTSCTVEEIALETIEVIKKANEVLPGKPVFIMGHSLGGLSVIYLGMWHGEELIHMEVKCLIASAPYISEGPGRPISTMEKYLLKGANYALPNFKISVDGGFEPEVPTEYSDYVTKHSKGCGYITPRCLVSCLNEMTKIKANTDKWPRGLHLLFFQGLKDVQTNGQENVEWANKLMEIEPQTVEIRVYENAPHQLTRVSERGDMFRHILDYMNTQSN